MQYGRKVGDEIKAGRAEDGPETLLTVASLGLIAEHLSQPLLAKDRELRLVLVNSSYCDLVGKPRERLLGKRETELSMGEGEPRDQQVISINRPLAGEHVFLDKHGREQRRPDTKIPLTDSNGIVTHVVSVIGHQGEVAATAEQLEQELERYAQERTRALKSVQAQLLKKERLMVLGQLAAGLAHQIRNPLGAISNAVALARRQVTSDQTIAVEALRIANEEIWEANRIITGLLDYARIQPPTRQDTALAEVVHAALAVDPLPDTVEVEIDVEEADVFVDQRQMRDALRNVIRNAREAMNGEGRLRFSSRVSEKVVELLVADTGVGIAQDQRRLLFEPLVSSKPLGIGLGLPTARALIMNQGGTLDCVATEGNGAVFLFRLPRRGRNGAEPEDLTGPLSEPPPRPTSQ
jgi:signal transduction histidine kinase